MMSFILDIILIILVHVIIILTRNGEDMLIT